MNPYQNELDIFTYSVKDHQLTIKRDDGVYRHLVLKNPNSGDYWFEIVTWPGCLYMGGDIGGFSFQRLTDMFEFFRASAMNINPGYWSEKLICGGQSPRDLIEEFNYAKFEKLVKEAFEEKGITGEEAVEGWFDIDMEVLYPAREGDNFHAIQMAAEKLEDPDFHENDLTTYTAEFIRACYAIVWGINQYDEYKLKQETAA